MERYPTSVGLGKPVVTALCTPIRIINAHGIIPLGYAATGLLPLLIPQCFPGIYFPISSKHTRENPRPRHGTCLIRMLSDAYKQQPKNITGHWGRWRTDRKAERFDRKPCADTQKAFQKCELRE